MIRTLAIVAAVAFAVAVVSLTSAVALAGGPFYIDHHLRFHRDGAALDAASAPVLPG
jgi:hypothetical protein